MTRASLTRWSESFESQSSSAGPMHGRYRGSGRT
jgi:hypothetical protein